MSSPFSAVKPSLKLADQVASTLETEIRAGRIQASEKLPTEAALAQQFEVSRTVVREAISRLKSLGLVDSRQGSGVYVKAPGIEPLHFDLPHAASREAVMQIVEVRRLFGGHPQPVVVVSRRHAVKAPDGVERQIDGVEFDVGNGMHQNGTPFGGGGRAPGHLGVAQQQGALGVPRQGADLSRAWGEFLCYRICS